MVFASFDEALLFDVFTAVSDEARAKSNKSLKKIKKMFMGTKNAIFIYATKALGGYVDVDFFK